jgi:hypothetical protein
MRSLAAMKSKAHREGVVSKHFLARLRQGWLQ